MNKAEMIEAIRVQGAHNTGRMVDVMTKKEAEAWLDAVMQVVGQSLEASGEATLPTLGKLKLHKKSAREGRNPKTGEAMTIPAKVAVKFVPAKSLKDFINV
jgi:DNA-binding protein HU-beta